MESIFYMALKHWDIKDENQRFIYNLLQLWYHL